MLMFEHTRLTRNANETLHAIAGVGHSGFDPSAVRRFLPRARGAARCFAAGVAIAAAKGGRTAVLIYLLRCETGGLANVLAGFSGMAAALEVRLSRI